MIHSRFARITALLTPYLLGTLLLIVLPAGISFFVAFTSYNGVADPVFVGWQNFQFLRYEPLFKVALINSLLFIAGAVPLRLLGALALALFYNRPRRLVGFHRAAAYLPTIIPDAAYALTWTWILNPLYGPLNASLRSLGLPTAPWLADSAWALPALILVSLFQLGEGFIILMVGLRHIPRETYDGAHIDGASRWQTFTEITLPLLSPWLVLLTVMVVAEAEFMMTRVPWSAMTSVWLAVFVVVGSVVIAFIWAAVSVWPDVNGNGVAIVLLS